MFLDEYYLQLWVHYTNLAFNQFCRDLQKDLRRFRDNFYRTVTVIFTLKRTEMRSQTGQHQRRCVGIIGKAKI